MNYTFTASRVSGDGNAVFPDEIIIRDDYLLYRKPQLIGAKETKIRFSAIGSVSVNKHILFADIIIETNGGLRVVAKGFDRIDADSIVKLLDSVI